MAKPRKGIIVNWQTKPTATALGVLMTAIKSALFMVVPMPNMMICSKGTISVVSLKSPTRIKNCGNKNATTAPMIIEAVKKRFFID